MYPWQQTQWQYLGERLQMDGLAHAYLLNGPKGIGKEEFAGDFASLLLCQNRDLSSFKACGKCHSCQLLVAGNHPDMKIVEPEGASQSIVVDRIREVIEYLSLKPHQGQHKIAIIRAADRMNVAAANSLLKSLEEPPSASMMFLSTCHPSRLLPTIRSRCQELNFPLPESDIARPWLASRLDKQEQAELFLSLANGSPLEALTFADGEMLEHRMSVFNDLGDLLENRSDAIKVASGWNKMDMATTMFWLWSFVADLSRLKVAEYPPLINNPDLSDSLRRLAQSIPLKNILSFQSRVENGNRFVAGNMNSQLMLEELLMHWSAIRKVNPREVFPQ